MTLPPRTLWTLILVFGYSCAPSTVVGAESKADRSLDDQLFESLGADPLDEFDRQLFAPADEKVQPPAPRSGGTDGLSPSARSGQSAEQDGLNRALRQELQAAGVSEQENPLLEIARQMWTVEGLIAEAESGTKTQDFQGRIVARLDELIRQARKRSEGGSSPKASPKVAPRREITQPKSKPGPSRGAPKSKPARVSEAQPGKAQPEEPDLSDWEAVRARIWGQLPQKAREQMLERPVEEFLPKYRSLIERYFQRLAEEPGSNND